MNTRTITQLLESKLETRFTSHELAKIKYFYLCLFHEGSKFIIMYIIFSLPGLQSEYLIALAVLLTIRNTSGGIHLKTYLGCLLFTVFFLSGAIAASHYLILDNLVQDIVLLICIPVLYFTGPVTSGNRPALTRSQHIRYTHISCLVAALYLLLFLCKEAFIYRNLCFWIIVFQIMQLIAARMRKKGVTYETENMESSHVRL